MLVAESLSKSHSGREVLRGVSLSVARGETVSIVGPSGCGKTSLLYMLCGLSAPDAGRVTLDSRALTRPTPDIAIILQDYGLLPWRTVQENACLGLKVAGKSRAEQLKRASAALLEVGLAGRERDYPSCLSGGEKQRVAIARALATGPRLLLMDEPFSSLDAITREKLQDTLLAVWSRSAIPYVLVTHSVDEAVYLGRRILVLGGAPASPRAEFENPGFGSPEFRDSRECFDLTREVRHAMDALFDAGRPPENAS